MTKKIIVDSNIIISSLIKENSKIRDILLNENFAFFSPEYVLNEISKHIPKIAKYSELKKEEILIFFHRILKNINFLKSDFISRKSREIAYHLCKDIDEKDTIYISLTIELDGFLWTGDKKLIKGLSKKNFKKTISTVDLIS